METMQSAVCHVVCRFSACVPCLCCILRPRACRVGSERRYRSLSARNSISTISKQRQPAERYISRSRGARTFFTHAGHFGPKNMVDAMSYFVLHQNARQEWTSKTLQSNTRPFRIGWLRRSKTGSGKETPEMLLFLFKNLQSGLCPAHKAPQQPVYQEKNSVCYGATAP